MTVIIRYANGTFNKYEGITKIEEVAITGPGTLIWKLYQGIVLFAQHPKFSATLELF